MYSHLGTNYKYNLFSDSILRSRPPSLMQLKAIFVLFTAAALVSAAPYAQLGADSSIGNIVVSHTLLHRRPTRDVVIRLSWSCPDASEYSTAKRDLNVSLVDRSTGAVPYKALHIQVSFVSTCTSTELM